MRIFGGIAKIAVPDIGEMSDAELLSAHVGGDRDAFGTLVTRHRDHLWHVAKRTSYSDEDAADALQDAMLSAHRMAATYRKDAAVLSWLHSIVVNACWIASAAIEYVRSLPAIPMTSSRSATNAIGSPISRSPSMSRPRCSRSRPINVPQWWPSMSRVVR